jgi:hypothetical protein
MKTITPKTINEILKIEKESDLLISIDRIQFDRTPFRIIGLYNVEVLSFVCYDIWSKHDIYEEIKNEFPILDWILKEYSENVVVAGGFICNLIYGLHQTDIDIFFHSCNKQRADQILKDISEKFDEKVFKSKNAVTIGNFQFILTLYENKPQILKSFDLGSCKVLLDSKDVLFTHLGAFCHKIGYNILTDIVANRYLSLSRINKYHIEKYFGIIVKIDLNLDLTINSIDNRNEYYTNTKDYVEYNINLYLKDDPEIVVYGSSLKDLLMNPKPVFDKDHESLAKLKEKIDIKTVNNKNIEEWMKEVIENLQSVDVDAIYHDQDLLKKSQKVVEWKQWIPEKKTQPRPLNSLKIPKTKYTPISDVILDSDIDKYLSKLPKDITTEICGFLDKVHYESSVERILFYKKEHIINYNDWFNNNLNSFKQRYGNGKYSFPVETPLLDSPFAYDIQKKVIKLDLTNNSKFKKELETIDEFNIRYFTENSMEYFGRNLSQEEIIEQHYYPTVRPNGEYPCMNIKISRRDEKRFSQISIKDKKVRVSVNYNVYVINTHIYCCFRLKNILEITPLDKN